MTYQDNSATFPLTFPISWVCTKTYNFYYINGSTNINILGYVIDFTLERELEKMLDKLTFKVSRSIDKLDTFDDFDPHVEIFVTFQEVGIFRGRIKESNKKEFYEVTAYSSAEILNRTFVQQVYTNTTPEAIFTDLISGHPTGGSGSYTDLIPIVSASGTTINRFVSNDYINNSVTKLVNALGWYCYTDSSKNIYFKPRGEIVNDIIIRRQVGNANAILGKWKKDHNEMCNDIRVTGENVNYSTTESFTGNFSTSIFTLNEAPDTIKITLSGNEESHDNYSVAKDTKQVIFNTAPASGIAVAINYDYAYPIFVAREDPASIAQYGRFTKSVINKWLKTRSDATFYCNNYLATYAQPLEYNDITMNAGNIPYFIPGEKIRIIDDIEGIDDYYTINKLKLNYLKGIIELNVGDYVLQFVNLNSILQSRVKELEKEDMSITLQINVNQSEVLNPIETLTLGSGYYLNFKINDTYPAKCDYSRGTLYDARCNLCQV